MKKCLFFVLMFVTGFLYSQNEWTLQTTGTTQNIYKVFFVDNYHGWAVGETGTILATVNGGHTWVAQTSGVTTTLNSVYFTNVLKGWIAGNSGKILYTTNGGTTWTAQTSGTTQHLLDICFANDTTGWAVGANGAIRHTTDGGTTWTAQTSAVAPSSNAVCFINDSVGWIAANSGKIIKTVNRGMNWTTLNSGTAFNLMSIYFTDKNNGWAVGLSATILHTSDGGTTWTTQTSTISNTNSLLSVMFSDSLHGWITGTNGTILYTKDGGTNWTDYTTTSINVSLRSIFILNQYNSWIGGYSGKIYNNKSHEKICLVLVDDVSEKNKVIWEKIAEQGTAYYKIYRLIGSVYTAIDSLAYDNMSEYIDITSQPAVMSYRYKISTVDSLGYESALSPYHETINLGVSQGVPSSTMFLSWNLYVDESGEYVPSWYYILRGTNPLNLSLYDSTSSANTSYNDLNIFSVYYYKIAINRGCDCVPTSTVKANGGPYSHSYSNMEDIMAFVLVPENNDDYILSIFPNPATDNLNLIVPGNSKSYYTLSVYSLTGNTVLNRSDISSANSKIDIHSITAGSYIIELKENASGKIYRGKLIVE